MKDLIKSLLGAMFIGFLLRICFSDKDMIEVVIDRYSHYKEYADSVLVKH